MCKHGDTVDVVVQVPSHLSNTGEAYAVLKPVDRCLAPIVKALNAYGVVTVACCCGHGHRNGNIVLADGRVLDIYPTVDKWERSEKPRDVNIHGEKLL